MQNRFASRAGADAGRPLPNWPQSDGAVKVPAAYLVEAAGFTKGYRLGPLGISPRHALSLVHYGGGSAEALLGLSGQIQQAVLDQFGIQLEMEPVVWGAS